VETISPNLDHADALAALDVAYHLLMEFEQVIANALEGDHHCAEPVDRWLTLYEQACKGESK
jgi:hypothetical protein